MNIVEKITSLMEQNKMRVSDVAKGSGIPYTTLDGIVKHDGTNIKLGTLVQIAKFFNVSLDYLTDDNYKESDYLSDVDSDEVLKKYTKLDDLGKNAVKLELNKQYERVQRLQENLDDFIDIPYYEDKAAAGTGYQLNDGRCEMMKVLRSRKTERADFIVTVSGGSMEPDFYDGENVLVHAQPDVYEGEIGIFIVNGNGFIKKKGNNRLISLNHRYRDIFIGENDEISCAGKVVGKLEESDYLN